MTTQFQQLENKTSQQRHIPKNFLQSWLSNYDIESKCKIKKTKCGALKIFVLKDIIIVLGKLLALKEPLV